MPAEMFGPYRLDALLGRGSMGEVWRAHDTVKERDVALKRLLATLAADGEFRKRFERESKIVARLNEPHIIPIHDFGEIDGRLYLTMRLVEGADLGTLLTRAGWLPPPQAVGILGQIAQALDAAHTAGLVHRDVKPSNVLVAGVEWDSDFAYLVDFGIARTATATALTATGATLGTFDYMAPERLVRGVCDHRADIYALGCLLYETLTGAKPFPGEGIESQMYHHVHTPPPQPSALRPELPAGLDQVVAQAMAKDPDRRYPTPGALAAAARTTLTSPSTTAAPTATRPATTGPASRVGPTPVREAESITSHNDAADTKKPAQDPWEATLIGAGNDPAQPLTRIPRVVPSEPGGEATLSQSPVPSSDTQGHAADAAATPNFPRFRVRTPRRPTRGGRDLLISIGPALLITAVMVFIFAHGQTPTPSSDTPRSPRLDNVGAPNQALATSAAVHDALSRVLKIRSKAFSCSRAIEGSGFVIGPDRVMTTATVVAGAGNVSVELRGNDGTVTAKPARVVAYKPQVDIAILAVPGLGLEPLKLSPRPAKPADDAIILGYPLDGPLTATPARIRSQIDLKSPDIYNTSSVVRDVYSLRAVVRPGSSGGPLLAPDGTVYGVMFASATNDDDTGFALTAPQVAAMAYAAPGLSDSVGTHACTP
jgi:serine/threonine-protein kinase